MNVNKVLTNNYEQMDTWSVGKNEPKTNPIEPNLSRRSLWRSRIKANIMPKQTQNEPNLSRRSLSRSRIKPNFTSSQRCRKAVRCRMFALVLLSFVHEREEKYRSPHLLIDPMLPIYKPGNDQYYIRRKCRCSSMVEHSFRKAEVVSSTLTIGCVNIKQKYNSLQEILKELGKVVVAYSGGVDSTFLLKAAVDMLSAENVLACISAGVAEPSNQLKRAAEQAKSIGVELQVIETGELDDPKFTSNKADRCFHCKSHICRILLDIAKEKGFDHVVFGTNYDDLDDFRPGNRAIKVFGIRSPLAEAELTKDDIRQLSREMNLPTADLPSSPCLASRIAYGLEVTEQRLKQVDEAEEFLRQLGLVEFRVRHHDTIARIEVNPEDIGKITAEATRLQIVEKLKSLGFKFVTIDLQGFRSGSLNEPLSEEEKQKSLERG